MNLYTKKELKFNENDIGKDGNEASAKMCSGKALFKQESNTNLSNVIELNKNSNHIRGGSINSKNDKIKKPKGSKILFYIILRKN